MVGRREERREGKEEGREGEREGGEGRGGGREGVDGRREGGRVPNKSFFVAVLSTTHAYVTGSDHTQISYHTQMGCDIA